MDISASKSQSSAFGFGQLFSFHSHIPVAELSEKLSHNLFSILIDVIVSFAHGYSLSIFCHHEPIVVSALILFNAALVGVALVLSCRKIFSHFPSTATALLVSSERLTSIGAGSGVTRVGDVRPPYWRGARVVRTR